MGKFLLGPWFYPCFNKDPSPIRTKRKKKKKKRAFLLVDEWKSRRFIDRISICKCVVNGRPAWFVWKLPAPPWSFVPPINHVTNFTSVAWSLIDKLTSHLASGGGEKGGRKIWMSPRILSFFFFFLREHVTLAPVLLKRTNFFYLLNLIEASSGYVSHADCYLFFFIF